MDEEELETKIYHKFCDISRICKHYFYDRKMYSNTGMRDAYFRNLFDSVEKIDKKSEELVNLYNLYNKQFGWTEDKNFYIKERRKIDDNEQEINNM